MKEIDGRTIPVGGKIVLIKSQNHSKFSDIRDALSRITICVEYSDIYDQKFKRERTLDFFGRKRFLDRGDKL